MNEEKIVIFVINNTGVWPSYFAMDLMNLYIRTLQEYPNAIVRTIETNSVENMRNYACRFSMGLKAIQEGDTMERYDYLVQLDVDHRYPTDFIIDLMKHKKDIVTGCTSRRNYPFGQTQFKKVQTNIKEESNVVNPNPEDPLIKIGASGPVGMLIKVDVLFKLKFPYYSRKYIGDENNVLAEMGSDVIFCEQLNEAGIDIWLDPAITFPHQLKRGFVNRGQLQF